MSGIVGGMLSSARLAFLTPLLAVLAAAALTPATARADDDDRPVCLTRNLHHMDAVAAGSGATVLYDRELRGQRAAARRIAREIGTRIFPRFKALLGRTPPSDGRERCYHGPDGRLDVYVTKERDIGGLKLQRGVLAFVHPFMSDRTCLPKRPVFAVVRPDVKRAVLAHELFHAFQAAYATAQSCIWYSEWEEATATWAGDYVYPVTTSSTTTPMRSDSPTFRCRCSRTRRGRSAAT